MPDPQTTNLDLYIPVRNADVGVWDVPANANMSQLDTVLGGSTTIALTNVNVTLSPAQYNSAFINLTGNLTGNIVLTLPAKGRSYTVNNQTTAGGFTITVTTGAGTSVVLPSTGIIQIFNDGTNVRFADGAIKTTADTAETTAVAAGASAALRVRAVVIQTFAGNGTYTPTAGMIYCIIECVGSGGGGGGVAGSVNFAFSGAGGGSGGYSRSIKTAAQVGVSQAVTVGGSAGGGAGAANGSNGSVTSVGALCSANGGIGGEANTGINHPTGGAGASAGTGDLALAGNPGGGGAYLSGTGFGVAGGQGGASYFGGGGTGGANFGANGGAANAPGAGGGGAQNTNSNTNRTGGASAAGRVVITEFVA